MSAGRELHVTPSNDLRAGTSPANAGGSTPALRNVGTDWKYIAVFYGIACGIAWIISIPLVLGEDGLKLWHIAPPAALIICPATLGPLVACYVTHRLQTGGWRAVRLLPRQRLNFVWLVLGPVLVLFCLFVVYPALISKGGLSAWRWHFSVLSGILVPMFNYNLLGGPLFEEFGWRGFLQPRLQRVLPPWIAAIVVGLMWAGWHLPFLFSHTWTSASTPVFFSILTGLSVLMAFGFNASGQSVIVAILMHSAFNASSRFLDPYLRGVATRERPSPESLIAISFLIVGAVLVLLTRGCLRATRT